MRLGATRVQWIALYYLGREEFINQKELGRKMKIKDSSVVRLVDRMERDGLVERVKNNIDKRMTCLTLTMKGKEYRTRLLPEGEKFQTIISQGISDEEMSNFINVLAKMVYNITNCETDTETINGNYTHT